MRSLFNKIKDKFAREKEDTKPTSTAPAVTPSPAPPRPAPQAQTPAAARPASAPRPQTPPAPRTPPPPQKINPYALTGSAQSQADWMLHQLGRVGKAFLAVAEKNKWSAQEGAMRTDVAAAMIAYRLVLTTYHVHQEQPSRETMRLLRTAMTALLHRAGDTGPKCEELLKQVEAEVATTTAALRNKSGDAFKSFYANLAPSFGGAADEDELNSRYAATLKDLYSKIESALLLRNSQTTG